MITSETGYPKPLTAKQRVVLAEIARYFHANGEPCTAAYLARRLRISKTSVGKHLEALHAKGWLPAPCAPNKPPTA
jgi:DNA-binding MarR family transcriptional regulator